MMANGDLKKWAAKKDGMRLRQTSGERHKASGQYTHGFEKICKRCGQPKGKHDAESPYANDDLIRGPQCDGFKAKVK